MDVKVTANRSTSLWIFTSVIDLKETSSGIWAGNRVPVCLIYQLLSTIKSYGRKIYGFLLQRRLSTVIQKSDQDSISKQIGQHTDTDIKHIDIESDS